MTTAEVKQAQEAICTKQKNEAEGMIKRMLPGLDPLMLDRFMCYIGSTLEIVFWESYRVGIKDGSDIWSNPLKASDEKKIENPRDYDSSVGE